MMKKLIFLLLFVVMVLAGAAQQGQLRTDSTSFRCQIEGQDITFPCRWSDLEQMGWSFSNPADSAELVLPTLNTILLDDRQISVISPQKRGAVMFFCNVSDKDIPRKESMVFGILHTSFASPITAYDFKLPSGITGGISTSDSLIATYGNPRNRTQDDLYQQWRYSEDISDDGFVVFIANDDTEVVPEGTVVGFGATSNAAVKEMIKQAGFAISDKQATDMREKRMYEQYIVGWTKELQMSATDSVKNNPVYIARIQYALAMNNYHLGNLDKAFEWMLLSAEAGNSEAEYSVGVMYRRGDGVEQDCQTAISWYEKAAKQGHAQAMSNLGSCYEDGNGVKQNYKQAFAWYEKAANSGDLVGVYNLSYMYYNGYGVKRDYRKAFEILLNADTSKYYAQRALGEHYYYGRGVKRDIPKAITHFNSFLNLIWNEDLQTNSEYAEEIAEARKIIDKNSKFETIRNKRIK